MPRKVAYDAVALALLLVATTAALAKDKNPKTYPERGTVVAVRQERETRTLGVYTDPYGKTHGGQSIHRMVPISRIETETRFYEVIGRLELGQAVEFRIEKNHAYMPLENGKEGKYRVVGVEIRPASSEKR